jgi:hypothetical protein
MIDYRSIIISWETFKSAFLASFGYEFCSLEDVVNHQSSTGITETWQRLDNWEGLSDLEIFQELVQLRSMSGNLYIVTEASYRKGLGPFKIGSSAVGELVAGHLPAYGEAFFNGDVLIADLDHKLMWAFHHEGVFAFIAPVSDQPESYND